MIRIAIVGTGGIAHEHMKAYLALKDRCRVMALVDIIPGKAKKFAEEFGLSCDTYEDHRDILTQIGRAHV